MSLQSPLPGSNALPDPFELDRLAEELDTRERAHAEKDASQDDDISPGRDLPIYIPLSHNNPYLTADTFNVEDFLLSRSSTSLPDLRVELRDYLSTLKEELVTLINDDYEAFITLSTDLRGEGVRLERMKRPLQSLKAQMLVSRSELQNIQDTIQGKLKMRAVLREETALLHLLLKISESMTRLEALLLITSPNEVSAASPRTITVKMPGHLSTAEDENIGDRTRGNRAKHLGRVAAEYAQLLYHVSKARTAKCAFVDEIQWRVDRVQTTLSSDLDHLFASTLVDLTESRGDGKATEPEKTKRIAELTECLRIYDILGLWRDAENVIRREVMYEFVKKTIFPGALAVPHSPIVPHTPFPPRSQHTTQSHPPRTPYTPFSVFASKQNPFELSLSSSTSHYAHLLDDEDDPLGTLYNQILRFVERDLSRIMDIAEKVSIKSVSRVPQPNTSSMVGTSRQEKYPMSSKASEEGFEIMANVVWADLGKAIMDELGGIVFSAGRPDEFRKHHRITTAFIRSLELLAPSLRSIEALRSHPVYSAFDRRWQLPVYFQMRWKEIVSQVEDALSTTRIDPMTIGQGKRIFATTQAAAVWDGIYCCWSAEVYIPELVHRFWKLTLQLLSRYKRWLNNSLPGFDFVSRAVIDDANRNTASHPGSNSPVPLPSEALSAESNAADDILLRQWAAAIVDITTMQRQMLTLWREEISMMLPEVSDDGDGVNLEDVLRQTLSKLTSLIPPISNQIVAILTRRACDALLPVRSIPSQFRAMSNKRTPIESSYFVSSILRPIKNFFAIGASDGPGAPLKGDFMQLYTTDVFQNVSQRYTFYLTAMKKTEESLRRLKKGRQSTFSLFGSSNANNDDDEERIRTQMILDVEAFGRDAESLGINPQASESFRYLNEMVHTSLLEVSEF